MDKIDTLLPFIHTLLNPVEMNSSNCDTCYATMKGDALHKLNSTVKRSDGTLTEAVSSQLFYMYRLTKSQI